MKNNNPVCCKAERPQKWEKIKIRQSYQLRLLLCDGHSSETVRKHYLKINKVEQAKKADLLFSQCFDKKSLKITGQFKTLQ
jgi:hypothetical protein